MKNNKGITLITLIITIIVIIIISAFTVYRGIYKYRVDAIDAKVLSDVSAVIEAVENREAMHKLNPEKYYYIGNNTFGTKSVGLSGASITYSSNDGWYLISDASKIRELGIENVVGNFLVNYSEGKAVSVDGIKYNNVVYYSLNELREIIRAESNQ